MAKTVKHTKQVRKGAIHTAQKRYVIKKGRFAVITAELVPEAQEVEDSRLEREIREEAEFPWVKEVLKVRIRHHLKVPAE